MTDETRVVHSDPEILSGTPVFVGTRVPIRSLFDYIEGGDTLDEFLRQFPSVGREQAIAALELARESLLTRRILLDENLLHDLIAAPSCAPNRPAWAMLAR